MKKYLTVWLFLFAVVGFEYYALNFKPRLSILSHLQHKGLIQETLEITSAPGRTVSLWLGWAGLSLMIVMNLYSMRKRFGFMQGWGKLSDWLNFHIFCGLLGPTFILFHCNFKVRGIVGISFWSMVISFTSGIIGRYFYVQMLREKSSLEKEVILREEQLIKILEKSKVKILQEEVDKYKQLALNYVGLPTTNIESLNPFSALSLAIAGDFRLALAFPERAQHWPESARYVLSEFALSKRRAVFLGPFQKLMGYWHTFHFPFAIFMYVVAVIHVVVAMVLGV